eukprot:CAMPEP_0172712032 /NCGR_PEP_ID=MMETSP1074-20121228/60864_1 /TAXON_ID=2916 /ORGANISM="Ceratium fusus, Strain PA161109" /LENGTH=38 /DNA_ID= /DNA_START= /DNA_END= /DNA_ORIENTATION=
MKVQQCLKAICFTPCNRSVHILQAWADVGFTVGGPHDD